MSKNQTSWESNLLKRPALKLGQLLSVAEEENQSKDHLLFTTPCDLGVIRNGGKRGSRHAPAAIMALVKSLNAPKNWSEKLSLLNFTAPSTNPDDFDTVQEEEVQFFSKSITQEELKTIKSLIHLGGGHDHAYPFARGLLKENPELLIINVDAHLDTRIDEVFHSGTPFRQIDHFAKTHKKSVDLIQVGIHNYSNSIENFDGMTSMTVAPKNFTNAIKAFLKKGLEKEKAPLLFLSVDCDGLASSFMSAVSAPNHEGLEREEFQELLSMCQDYWNTTQTPAVCGFYEYNPIFENLDCRGSRYIAAQIYKILTNEK